MTKRDADIIKNVLDTSEMDVPARCIPKDISSKEERQSLHGANLNSTKTLKHPKRGVHKNSSGEDIRDQLYSPNQFPDSLYSPTELSEDVIVPSDIGYDDVVEWRPTPQDSKKPCDLLFNNMYTRLAACVTALNMSPKEGAAVMIDKLDAKFLGMTGDDVTAEYESEDYDEDEEENVQQIRRLTSWNTLGTYGTIGSEKIDGSVMSGQLSAMKYARAASSARRMGSSIRKPRRKRTVKFDYPIVKSLKECPRPDPNDLPNLYFTEEELGQIEDDRESTFIADDVEVVCVSTSHSSEAEEMPLSPASEASVLPGRDSSLLAPTPRFGQSTTRSNRMFAEPDGATTRAAKDLALQTRNPAARKPVDGGRKRQIKSVQIYLRERSRERTQKS